MVQAVTAADLVKKHEGLSLSLYKDTLGLYTIGYGHCLSTRGISQRVADFIFQEDYAEAERVLANNFKWFANLSEARQAAMVDLSFNLGYAKLLKFEKFLAAMAQGNFEIAGNELIDSDWFRQVGVRGPHIVALIKKEEWPK